ncbi:hypothetical protein [Algicella marina]|uniref:Outer membrane beta-barrel protein n=1 Tax=Algicella marina TaxID=2683284 RepID=A0A6P1SYJ6_9RHOB|nr:hypothetical protein [Algicella marina]QHQ34079.1 hypothetical protein GO499_02210 [Algicella marina]
MNGTTKLRPVLTISLLSLAGTAIPQSVPEPLRDGGQRFAGVVTQAFEADSNFALDPDDDDPSLFATTTLGLGYFTDTRTQSFSVISDIELRGIKRSDDDAVALVTLPSLDIGYDRIGSASSFGIEAGFRETSLLARRTPEAGFTDSGFVVPGDLTPEEGSGRRQDYDAGVAFTFGEGGPIEGSFALDYDRTLYIGANDDLNDVFAVAATGGLDFRINPVITGVLESGASYTEVDSAEGEERRAANFRAGIEYDVSERLMLTSGVGYIFDEQIRGDTTERLEGPLFDVGFELGFQRSTLGAAAAVVIPDEGSLVFLGGIGYEHEWRTGGAAAEFALESRETGDTVGTATVSISQDLGRGDLRFNLSRSLETSREGDDTIISAFGLGYFQPVSNRINFGAEVAGAVSENLDVEGDDRTQFRLSVGAEYLLTERASISARYSHRRESIEDSASGHSLRIALEVPFGG